MPPATYPVLAVVGAQMGYGDGLEMFLGCRRSISCFFLLLVCKWRLQMGEVVGGGMTGFFDLQVGMVGGVALGHMMASFFMVVSPPGSADKIKTENHKSN